MDRLIEKIINMNNPSVFGLDPKPEYIPNFIIKECYEQLGENDEGVAAAFLRYNKSLIDALCDIVPAVKPQSAYYEAYGFHGVRTFYETIKYARSKGLYVIADVKRNDIGSTAEAYAKAYLGDAFGADSATVNGYLGTDGIKPFTDLCEKNDKTIFALVKTSNPSSGELQDLPLASGVTVCEKMAELVNNWGGENVGKHGYTRVGAVVGATYPEHGKRLREMMPKTYFLVPGYGAQGGDAKSVAVNFNADGLGAIVNSSRAIMCAYQKTGAPDEAFADAARAEAIRMRDEINSIIGG